MSRGCISAFVEANGVEVNGADLYPTCRLITIYDCKVVLEWKAWAADGTEANGKLTIPEVSHEITLDGLSDYVVCASHLSRTRGFTDVRKNKYHWSLTSQSSSETAALFNLAKSKLPIALETKFAAFPVELIDTHGKDIIVGSNEPSRTSSPAPPAPSASAPAGPVPAKKAAASSRKINTSAVEVEATFHASGDDLFSLLTDPNRIPLWSRAPAKVLCRAGEVSY